MTLGGWLGDRYGAKRIVILWQIVGVAMCLAMYFGVGSWNLAPVFMAFVYAWVALDMLLTVAGLPISMRLCDAKVAATQFTIYMAVANFGISFGAFVLSQADALGGLTNVILVTAAGLALGLLLMLTVKYPRHPEYYAQQTEAALVFDTSDSMPKTSS